MKLSIFSVVKNEEAMIEDMLKSAAGADEHVIIDTGSTDRTIDICKKYTPSVYTDYKWRDDFAEAKNLAMERCTGDWIMGLDADCRLEPGGIKKLRAMCEAASEDVDVLNVKLAANTLDNPHYHLLAKVFRAKRGIKYIGRVHETPNKLGTGKGDVTIVYKYSPNHHKDPMRNIRILLQEDQTKPRTLFYLGREHYERRMYDKALEYFEKYLAVAKWPPEITEAFICVARCYWYTGRGDEARKACMYAIKWNPDCKEALRLMAEMHYEPWKSKWLKFATIATNKDVLFVRT